MAEEHDVLKTFRNLVENAERNFARVRDLPVYVRGQINHHHKVFNAYTKLWKFQLENRICLVEAGLQRWEIGEVASRIGQLYFGQYIRTSQARFLSESYVFYEAILKRGYFEGSKSGSPRDIGLKFKELRFYARFLVVSLLLNRSDLVPILFDRFRLLVAHSKASFQVKLAEVTLDTYRMLQCLEWDPSGNLSQMQISDPKDNTKGMSCFETSCQIYKNLGEELVDSTLLPNPRKAILYHPSVSHLISTLAVICEELSPGCVVLVYLSASGKDYCDGMAQQTDITEVHQRSLKKGVFTICGQR